MKKLSKIHLFMAAFIVIGSFPAHGMQQVSSITQTVREKALKQFNDSVKRMRKCIIERKCNQAEALKIARDLSIAVLSALAAAGIVYGGKKFIDDRRMQPAPTPPLIPPPPLQPTSSLTTQPIQEGGVVYYLNKPWTVEKYHQKEDQVNLQASGASILNIPITELDSPPQKEDKVIYIGNDPQYQRHLRNTFTVWEPNTPYEHIAIMSSGKQIIAVPKTDIEKVKE